MARGSGLTGLAGMVRATQIEGISVVRPLLDRPKAQLIATLAAVGIAFADDPSNRDPKFTRARLRRLLPALAEEGLDAGRFALLARRLRRADETIEVAVDAAAVAVAGAPWTDGQPVVIDAAVVRADCRPKWPCACSAAPSRIAAARGRFSSASSKRLSSNSAAH